MFWLPTDVLIGKIIEDFGSFFLREENTGILYLLMLGKDERKKIETLVQGRGKERLFLVRYLRIERDLFSDRYPIVHCPEIYPIGEGIYPNH